LRLAGPPVTRSSASLRAVLRSLSTRRTRLAGFRRPSVASAMSSAARFRIPLARNRSTSAARLK
jgi:hypothetical protein